MGIINARYVKPTPCPVATGITATMHTCQITQQHTYRKIIQKIKRGNNGTIAEAA
jgi:hypothetical protein